MQVIQVIYFILSRIPIWLEGLKVLPSTMTSHILGNFHTTFIILTLTTMTIFSKETKARTLDNPDGTKEILKAFIKVGPIPQNGQCNQRIGCPIAQPKHAIYIRQRKRKFGIRVMSRGWKRGSQLYNSELLKVLASWKFVHRTTCFNALVANDFQAALRSNAGSIYEFRGNWWRTLLIPT